MPESTTNETILLVEDTKAIIDLINTSLSENGYLVSCATNGFHALKIAPKLQPSLILLDILMPEMDGYETCRLLKENEETKNIPIIFLSALTQTFDKVKAFQLGGVDFISKPIETEELLARIRTHLTISRLQKELENTNKILTESEAKFRILFEQAAVGVSQIDSRTGKFIKVNKKYADIIGYTIEEMKNLDFQTITHPDDLVENLKNVEQLRSGAIPEFTMEKRYIHKNGDIVWVEVFVSPMWKKDSIPDFNIAVISDITERKLAQLQLQKYANELNTLNVNKDRFISILAHDLKNPFTTLLGFSGLLKENIHKYDLDKIEKQSFLIYQSAIKIYRLLEDLLMWAKTQSGKLPFVPQRLSFSKICQYTLDNLQITADAKNIAIHYDPKEEVLVLADVNMVRTILRNLVSNAIKFSHIGGQITIYTEMDNANLIVTVSDNGIGISAESINKLFDISQMQTTLGTANETGSGLGLILCKDFVEKHGGRIWVESEIGIGSSFKFTLPVVE